MLDIMYPSLRVFITTITSTSKCHQHICSILYLLYSVLFVCIRCRSATGRRPRATTSPERPASSAQSGIRPVFLDALRDVEAREGRDLELKVKVAGEWREVVSVPRGVLR